MTETGEVVDQLETPPFLLNCNRTQQRYTNAMILAARFVREGQPAEQSYFLKEGGSGVLASNVWSSDT